VVPSGVSDTCFSSRVPVTIAVTQLPVAAGTVTGTANTCDDEMGVPYLVPAITNATSYNWSYTGTGETINGTGNSITVDFAAGATSGDLSVYGVNSCGIGAASTFSVTVIPCAGVEENNAGISMTILPNPNPGVFSIEMDALESGLFTMKIFNSLGQVVLEKQVNIAAGQNRIDVDMLQQPTGNYFLHMINSDHSTVKSFIISK
jgi:hypothetical protein